jgi:hypothetical protein
VDADANLEGELRSAHWFAGAGVPGDWTVYHVDEAARRAGRVDWASVYPVRSHRRAWALAGLFALAGVVASLTVPALERAPWSSDAAELEAFANSLPPELREQLEEWLRSLDADDLAASDPAKADENVVEFDMLLDDLPPELREKLMDLARARQAADAADPGEGAPGSEPGEHETARLDDLRWEFEDAAAREAAAEASAANPAESADAEHEGEQSGASEGQSADAATPGQAARMSIREAVRESAASQMMMESDRPTPGGDSGPGGNGQRDDPRGSGGLMDIAQALRREQVQAHADANGDRTPNDDIRRRTEQTSSALAYGDAVDPAAGDRSRSVGAAPPPDGRRSLVYDYFTRRP